MLLLLLLHILLLLLPFSCCGRLYMYFLSFVVFAACSLSCCLMIVFQRRISSFPIIVSPALMEVKSDLFLYRSGVYRQTNLANDNAEGNFHSVKIIGWGEDNDGRPYWVGHINDSQNKYDLKFGY